MKHPCGIIQDLLPVYIDNLASEESRAAVEEHLAECENCKKHYETMKRTDCIAETSYDNTEDLKMADNLKKIKHKINKKYRNIVICSAAAVLMLIFAFSLLFNIPIKNIALRDISAAVSSYPMEEIASIRADANDSFSVRIDDNDNSEIYRLEIPAMPNYDISVSKDTMEENRIVSVINWSSPYHIREIQYAAKTDDKTIYVKAFKTTVFNNKVVGTQQSMQSFEFRDIDKIIFVDGEQEKVLWSK